MTVCELHHGDWREVASTWPRPCVVIMDPPYGIRHRVLDAHTWARRRSDFVKAPVIEDVVHGDKDTTERDAALDTIDWSAAAVFGPRRLDLTPPWGKPRDVLIFDKGPGVGAGDLDLPWKPCWETIAIYGPGWEGKRTSAILRGSKIAFRAGNAPNGRRHPTEKPLSVVLELVRKAPPDLPIIDPFMGSGTTGVAAKMCDRDFYGAEIVREYFDVCAERLLDVVPDLMQRSIFEDLDNKDS